MRAAWLLWCNCWRTMRPWGVFSEVVVLALAEIAVASAVVHGARGLAGSGPYFLAVAGVGAGAASWETELVTATAVHWSRRPLRALVSRLVIAAITVAAPLAAFSVLDPGQTGRLALITVTWVAVGALLPLALGMYGDKTVNNALQAVPWLLALGPGPFFLDQRHAWTPLFPGAGSPVAEGVRSGVLLAACAIAVVALDRPRRRSPYSA